MAARIHTIETLEQGELYFFYRPRVETHEVRGPADVQKLYMALAPASGDVRLLTVGRKRMPDVLRRERLWGYVEGVGEVAGLADALGTQTYETKTRGPRVLPAVRPAGEAAYRLVRHGDHTHLLYALSRPSRCGPVQRALGMELEASYIVAVCNPERAVPPSRGRAVYPPALQERFRGRRYAMVEPALLDRAGAEFVLLAAHEEPAGQLGIELDIDAVRPVDEAIPLEAGTSTAPLEQGVWA